jgi:hypothetical protein
MRPPFQRSAFRGRGAVIAELIAWPRFTAGALAGCAGSRLTTTKEQNTTIDRRN